MKAKIQSLIAIVTLLPNLTWGLEKALNTDSSGTTWVGAEFFAIQDKDYLIEESFDLLNWHEFTTVAGADNRFFIPFFEQNSAPLNCSEGSTPPVCHSLTPVTVVLRDRTGGGAIMSWQSFDGSGLVHAEILTPDLSANWQNHPLASVELTDHYAVILNAVGSGYSVTLSSGLTQLDQDFFDDFSSNFASLQSSLSTTTASYSTPASKGPSKFYRVKDLGLSDFDQDGIFDKFEKLTIAEGGTETNPYAADSDDDGVDDGSEHLESGGAPNDPNSCPPERPVAKFGSPTSGGSSGGGSSSSGGGGIATPNDGPMVVEVAFHDDQKIGSDDGMVVYRNPKWKSGSHNFPVVYVKKDTISLGAKFFIPGLPEDFVPKVEATLPDNITLPLTNLVKGQPDGVWNLAKTACQGELLDFVRYFSAQEEGLEFEINWKVKMPDSGSIPEPLVDAGTTCHSVYVVYQKPVTTQIQETLFYLGCKNASGSLNNTNVIVDAIYSDFIDRDVSKVFPTKAKQQDQPMLYYGDVDGDGQPDGLGSVFCSDTFAEMLAEANGNGTCAAWATLLYQVFAVQGIDSSIIEITSTYDATPGSNVVPATIVSALVAKNLDFGAPQNFGQDEPYKWARDINANIAPNPVPGQGESSPPLDFATHLILNFGGSLYDPSYGSPKTPNGPNLYKRYEDATFDAFTRQTNNPLSGAVYYRKNDITAASGSEVKTKLRNDLKTPK